MDMANFSGRDVLIGIIILVALYLLFSVVRLLRLRRSANKAESRRHPSSPTTMTEVDAAAGDGSAVLQFAPSLPQSPATSTRSAATTALTDAQEPLSAFEFQLYRNRVDNELRALRQDIEDLRKALAQIHAAGRVSAQYSEAMALAQRGVDTQIIAERCAISLGEAELVAALSRNEEDYGNENLP